MFKLSRKARKQLETIKTLIIEILLIIVGFLILSQISLFICVFIGVITAFGIGVFIGHAHAKPAKIIKSRKP